MTDDELAAIEARAARATPGPWYRVFLDDDHAMNLVAVSTVPDDGAHARYPEPDAGTIVAATLVQAPRYVDVEDGRWDENAEFVAHARADVPSLIAEIRRLLRWMIRTHCALAEHGETALEGWTMRRLEAAMEGKDADEWRERIGEVE